MKEFLAKLRKDYGKMGLSELDLNPDPIKQFESWFTEAANAEISGTERVYASTVSALGKLLRPALCCCAILTTGLYLSTRITTAAKVLT